LKYFEQIWDGEIKQICNTEVWIWQSIMNRGPVGSRSPLTVSALAKLWHPDRTRSDRSKTSFTLSAARLFERSNLGVVSGTSGHLKKNSQSVNDIVTCASRNLYPG